MPEKDERFVRCVESSDMYYRNENGDYRFDGTRMIYDPKEG